MTTPPTLSPASSWLTPEMPCKSDQKMEDGDNVLGVDRLNTPTGLDKWAFKMEFGNRF